MRILARRIAASLALVTLPAAPAHAAALVDGTSLSLLWGVPFAGILLSIALFPVLAGKFWHHHYPKVSLAWALAFLVPFAAVYGPDVAGAALFAVTALEYLPFIIMLFALFVVSGGIHIGGRLAGTPGVNAAMLAIGTILASFIGTTGAAMLLIRPMIAANATRQRKVHIFVFFIFLVGNIGGSLTPLGDPPLFLGFIKGIDFFWTMKAMAGPMFVTSIILIAAFFVIDSIFYRAEAVAGKRNDTAPNRITIEGGINFLFLALVIAAVLLSGIYANLANVKLFGTYVPVESIARNVVLLVIAWAAYRLTPAPLRAKNQFSWEPIREVAILFIGIFVTIIPVIAILAAGTQGAAAEAVRLVSDENGAPVNLMYFWLTGGLSAFLDNAPTYLVFFNLAGGDPATLMGPLSSTLLAISMGAVFMGAFTYIGNAPNFMIKAICEERGIAMPSFFGFIGWSAVFLLPVFALVSSLFL
ncbi:MAG TPA: sodium:proton antiporter [Micropepsaceae bacterium]|nr:sodium:proton antiporter [Micropepsaceae bacterium]